MQPARTRRLRPILDGLRQDVRGSVRTLRRSPTFALAALVTLALGIGATTGIFSVVNAVLLAPPPYPDPDRILAVASPDGLSQNGPIYHLLRDRARAMGAVAAQRGATGWNLVAGARVEYVTGVAVSARYFDVLGVPALIGRGFTEIEDRPGGPRAIVLAERVWHRIFEGDPAVIGRTAQLGGVQYTIVGVMPARLRTVPAADLWTPLQLARDDDSWNYQVLGRLRPGASRVEAAAEMDALRSELLGLPGVSESRSQGLRWVGYQEYLGRDRRTPLLLLLASVTFLLLIACVNVAGLQLARAITRQREMATRAALGAGSGRLSQQVLTESIVLSAGGAVLGLALARWGVRTLLAFVPAGLLGDATVTLDWRVLIVTASIGVAAGILFGLAPTLGARRLDVRAALGDGARQTSGRDARWLRRTFLTVQIALAVVLLVGAGLLIRTFVSLQRAELGFDRANVIVGQMSLQGSSDQTQGQLATFFASALDRIRVLPAVEAASVSNAIPVARGLNLVLEPPPDSLINSARAVDWQYVTPGYLDVFRIPLRDGRRFDSRDGAGGAPVALVDEAFARTYFGRQRVIGRTIRLAGDRGDPVREIVGLVANVKRRSGSGWTGGRTALGSAAPPTVYVPVAQLSDDLLRVAHAYFPVSWSIRTRGPRPEVVSAIQRIVGAQEARLPFIGFQTMDQVIARDVEMERFLMTLLGAFALIALTLAATGLYGLVAHAVTQRTTEVGIRLALGATGGQIERAFLFEGLALTGVGVALGVGGAAFLTRFLESFVIGVRPLDATTFAGVAALLAVVAGLATLLPARRAGRTDPMRALRVD